MNSAPLIQLLSSITTLPGDLLERLGMELHQENYKARQIIQAAGQLENRLYYLESGFARSYYYDHHGNEHTVKFWEAGDIVFSYEGYYNVTAYYYTEIVEDSQFITISYDHLHQLDLDFPAIQVIIKSVLLSFQHEEYEKQKLIALSTEERYQVLRKKKPIVFGKVPVKVIASYLNMTRETLSRFMAKR